MTKRGQVIILSTTDFKILETVALLNTEDKYPLSEGIGKILKGEEDEETLPFIKYPTFKTLISYSSKKISRYILMLLRYHYLERIYDEKTEELYLKITELGKEELKKNNKKHHPHYKKRMVVNKPTIVTIK